jgi:D-sedoheptulose 7-phosphate isomerase
VSFEEAFDEHERVLRASKALVPVLEQVARQLRECLRAGGKVLVCGNGGSAAEAQHFASELVGRCVRQRKALAAIALTADPCCLTAVANDFGFEQVFVRQLEALACEGDVLVALSTSGNSANVLAAARTARALKCPVVGLTGADGGSLAGLADLSVCVPSRSVERIQELHQLVLHALVAAVEAVDAR